MRIYIYVVVLDHNLLSSISVVLLVCMIHMFKASLFTLLKCSLNICDLQFSENDRSAADKSIFRCPMFTQGTYQPYWL